MRSIRTISRVRTVALAAAVVLLSGCAADPMDYVPKYHMAMIEKAGGGTGRESFTVKEMLDQVRTQGSRLEALRLSLRFGKEAHALTPVQLAELSKRVSRFLPKREYKAVLMSGPGDSDNQHSITSASAAMKRLNEVAAYIRDDVRDLKQLYNPNMSPHIVEVEFRPIIKPGEKLPGQDSNEEILDV